MRASSCRTRRTESRPLYSPDGDRLAFVSDRTGGGDIYVLSLKTGVLNQVTVDDGLERLDAWSRDGRWLYFSSTSRDIAGMNDLYRVRADGGTPMLVSADRYTGECFAAPSPDGLRVAFAARGNSSGQWWRKGHSHLDESELWILDTAAATPRYERVTERGAKQMWPMWSADGKTLFYMSDRSGAQNIWTQPVGGAARQVTRFTDGRVLWPTISYDGRTIVFERDFEIWKLDTSAAVRRARSTIAKRGVPPTAGDRARDAQQPVPGPVAVARWPQGRLRRARRDLGRVRARRRRRRARDALATRANRRSSGRPTAGASSMSLSATRRRTCSSTTSPRRRNAADERRDGRRGAARLAGRQVGGVRARRQGAARARPRGENRTVGRDRISQPQRSRRSVVARQPLGCLPRAERQVVPERLRRSRGRRRQPRGQRAAKRQRQQHLVEPGRHLHPLQHQPADGGGPGRARRSRSCARRASARIASAISSRRPSRRVGGTRSAAPRDRERDAEPARDPSKPVEIVFDDIRRRLSLLPVGVDVTAQTISPDGRSLLLTATAEGQQNLYIYSLDELAREPAVARQLTSTAGAKSTRSSRRTAARSSISSRAGSRSCRSRRARRGRSR